MEYGAGDELGIPLPKSSARAVRTNTEVRLGLQVWRRVAAKGFLSPKISSFERIGGFPNILSGTGLLSDGSSNSEHPHSNLL